MNNAKNRKFSFRMLLATAALVAICAVVGMLAFLHDKTGELPNSFLPSEVSCTVDEQFTGSVKSNVCIRNTGDVDAYIRAEVVATWQNDSGDVWGTAPQAGTDYNISFANGWTESGGFYYWPSPVEPFDTTGTLISAASAVSGKAPEGYHLCIDILGSAIQADGTTDGTSGGTKVVTDAWGISY